MPISCCISIDCNIRGLIAAGASTADFVGDCCIECFESNLVKPMQADQPQQPDDPDRRS